MSIMRHVKNLNKKNYLVLKKQSGGEYVSISSILNGTIPTENAQSSLTDKIAFLGQFYAGLIDYNQEPNKKFYEVINAEKGITNILLYISTFGYIFKNETIDSSNIVKTAHCDYLEHEETEMYNLHNLVTTCIQFIIDRIPKERIYATLTQIDIMQSFKSTNEKKPQNTLLLHAIHSQNIILVKYLLEYIKSSSLDDEQMRTIFEYRDQFHEGCRNAFETSIAYMHLDTVEHYVDAYPKYLTMKMMNFNNFNNKTCPNTITIEELQNTLFDDYVAKYDSNDISISYYPLQLFCLISGSYKEDKLNNKITDIIIKLLSNKIVEKNFPYMFFHVSYRAKDSSYPHYMYSLPMLLNLNLEKIKLYREKIHLMGDNSVKTSSFGNLITLVDYLDNENYYSRLDQKKISTNAELNKKLTELNDKLTGLIESKQDEIIMIFTEYCEYLDIFYKNSTLSVVINKEELQNELFSIGT